MGREPTTATARPATLTRSRALRALYVTLGCAFVALGVIGAFLPVLPTTPFMLLALWAFSRSSARLEAWLLNHRRFGPSLRRWREHRVVPLRAKIVAWTSMAASLTWMIVGSTTPRWAILPTALLMAYAVWFVARLPSKPPATDARGPGDQRQPPAIQT